MSSKLVLSAVGPDQVGLVEKISAFLGECKANIEDSKMAVFCGEFAIIMLVSGDDADLSRLEENQSELAVRTGLHVFLRRPSETRYSEKAAAYRLIASSLDHPGIVHRLTSELSSAGINIDSMETKTYPAPWSGTPMFRFEAHLSIPDHINIPRLRSHVLAIGEEENIDVELTVRRDEA